MYNLPMQELREREGTRSSLPRLAPHFFVGALVLVGLYLTSRYSYNLFHSIAELFSVTVAVAIFMIAWNTRRMLSNNYFLFLGIGYLFVAGVDLLHTLAYKGMGVFERNDADLPTQLWLAARYLQTAALLLAPLVLSRTLRLPWVFAGFASAATLLTLSIFVWPVFPAAFVEGEGLTPFKVASEYVMSALLLGAVWLLLRRRDRFEPSVVTLLTWSILLVVLSELAFTLYQDVYGFTNVLGHFLKIASVYLLYKALVETALVRPYSLLFREVKQSEEALRESEERYRDIADSLQEALLVVPERVPGVRFGHLYRSATLATRVGGDFYDIFEIDERQLGVIIGDVSGKGLKAATLTSLVKDTIRAYAYDLETPAAIMAKTNEVLLRLSDPSSFVTAFFAVLDRESGSVLYSSAGHPPAILARKSGGSQFLPSQSPVLGAFGNLPYDEGREILDGGDLLVLYTDGVTEARRGPLFYGEDRLLRLTGSLNGMSAQEVPGLIYDDILRHSQGDLSDDMAVLAIALASEPVLPPDPELSPSLTVQLEGRS
jgi:serine phosphatase RsbU (regulator of sigma subunit)